jgi:hypothetical protein
VFGLWRKWKRSRLEKRPFPEAWRSILERSVPFYPRLPSELRSRFETFLKVFVWEKYFEGAQGLEITDEIRVVVSAAAVRLILHLDLSYYDRLRELVIYPFDYQHPGEADHTVFGEAHDFGTVVLSWPAVQRGIANPDDGLDTATHEFAHVLDLGSGSFDGAPVLRSREDYRPWAEVMATHFDRLGEGRRPERKVLRDYGATNPAEFFAVATEAFFEKPSQMRRHTPELYDRLVAFYGLDPAPGGGLGLPAGLAVTATASCPCGSGRTHRACCRRGSAG